jgi:hypothetical protein
LKGEENKMNSTIKKTFLGTLIAIMLIAPSMALMQVHAASFENPPPNWNVSGTWAFVNTSHDYPVEGGYSKIMAITQNDDGTFAGSGNNIPQPGHLWSVLGFVAGDSITFKLEYSTIQNYAATFVGDIDASGHMSGTWSDVTQDFGNWNTIRGQAIPNENYVPPGQNVIVNPSPNVALTFADVTSSGSATVDISTTPPENFPPLSGIIGPYYDIQVTALFSGKVKVCIKYDDQGLSLCQEQKLRLFTSDGILPIGDVNHDGKVDLKDTLIVTLALGSKLGKPRWNAAADLNNDGIIDSKDLGIVIKHFGESSWVDITYSIDTLNNVICGYTDHFSGFGVHR